MPILPREERLTMPGISRNVPTVHGKNMTYCIVFGVFIVDALPSYFPVNGRREGGERWLFYSLVTESRQLYLWPSTEPTVK